MTSNGLYTKMPALRGSFFPLSCSVLAASACLPPFSVRHVLPALCMLPAVTHAPPLSGSFFGLPPACLWLLPPFRMFPAVTRTFPFSFSSVSRHVLPAFRMFPAVTRIFFFFPLLLFTAMFLSLRSFFISAVSAPVSPSFFGATKKSPEKALRSYFFYFSDDTILPQNTDHIQDNCATLPDMLPPQAQVLPVEQKHRAFARFKPR